MCKCLLRRAISSAEMLGAWTLASAAARAVLTARQCCLTAVPATAFKQPPNFNTSLYTQVPRHNDALKPVNVRTKRWCTGMQAFATGPDEKCRVHSSCSTCGFHLRALPLRNYDHIRRANGSKNGKWFLETALHRWWASEESVHVAVFSSNILYEMTRSFKHICRTITNSHDDRCILLSRFLAVPLYWMPSQLQFAARSRSNR